MTIVSRCAGYGHSLEEVLENTTLAGRLVSLAMGSTWAQAYLVGTIARLNGCDKDVLMPAHTTPNGEVILLRRILKRPPTTASQAVVSKASLTCDGDVAPVRRYDGGTYWPLLDEIVRRSLNMLPDRCVRRENRQVCHLISLIRYEPRAGL